MHRNETPDERQGTAEALDNIRDILSQMRFGSITVTVHEGRVVQIDVTEKKRFARPA